MVEVRKADKRLVERFVDSENQGEILIVIDLDKRKGYVFNRTVALIWRELPSKIEDLTSSYPKEIVEEAIRLLSSKELVEIV